MSNRTVFRKWRTRQPMGERGRDAPSCSCSRSFLAWTCSLSTKASRGSSSFSKSSSWLWEVNPSAGIHQGRCTNTGKLFQAVALINQCFPWPDSAGGLGGYDILKVHDAEPFLGVEVKFVDVAACQQFLESYSSGAVLQSLNQHACRLLGLPQDFTVRTQLKAGPQNLDLCLDQLAVCLQHIHLSQVGPFFYFLHVSSSS